MNESSSDRPAINRRASLLRLSSIAVGVAVVAGGGVFAWKKLAAKNQQPEYVFGQVQRGDIEDLVSGTGSLQPRDYVDVGAQVSGQLKKIHVEVGSEVREGDLLAEINPEQYLARVDAIRAQLRNQQSQMLEREAQLAQAETTFKRQTNLKNEDATTADALLSADTQLRVARAQINSLRAQTEQTESSLRVEEANLKYAQIYAPMTGTVVSIAAKQGQTLNANQQAPVILRLADLSTMTVQTQVSEADVSKLWPGMEAYFTTLGSRGRRWFGQLRKIEPTPTVQNNVVLYNALFDVLNPSQTLMTQMTAQVFFVAALAENALVVPMSALTFPKGAGRNGRGEGGQEAAGGRRRQREQAVPGASAPSAASNTAKPDAGAERLAPSPVTRSSAAEAAPRPSYRTPEEASPAAATRGRGEEARSGDDPGRAPLTQEEREERRRRRWTARQAEGASRPEHVPSEGRQGRRAEESSERESRDGSRQRPAEGASAPEGSGAERPRRFRNDGEGSSSASRPTTMHSNPATPPHGGRSEGARRDRPTGNAPRSERRTSRGPQPLIPRKAVVKISAADGTIADREVMIGISSRVQAQVLSGLKEGERIVVGIKQPEQPERRQATAGQGGPGMPGGMGGGLGGGLAGAGGQGGARGGR